MDKLLLSIVAYLIGGIPFGLIILKLKTGKDIRKIGSGNIGATNVYRVGGFSLALLTLVLDIGKGMVMVYLARYSFAYDPDVAIYVGFFAVVGHMFPLWLRFKGGKGVATTIGVLLAVDYHIGLVALCSWSVAFLLTRISSASSIIAMIVAIIYVGLFGTLPLFTMTFGIAALVIFRHKENIWRLFQGKERPI